MPWSDDKMYKIGEIMNDLGNGIKYRHIKSRFNEFIHHDNDEIVNQNGEKVSITEIFFKGELCLLEKFEPYQNLKSESEDLSKCFYINSYEECFNIAMIINLDNVCKNKKHGYKYILILENGATHQINNFSSIFYKKDERKHYY